MSAEPSDSDVTSVKALDFIALSINLSLLEDSGEGMVCRDTRERSVHPRVWGNGPYADDWESGTSNVKRKHINTPTSLASSPPRFMLVTCGGAQCRRREGVGGMRESWYRWYLRLRGPGGDPEDEGRGFFSAGWGNGHEGVGDSGCRPREPVGLEGKSEVEVKHRVSAEWRPK
ncbi:hypothetical protein BGY98DRAFT_1177312 [Russula aff. rugulosa BPL654]|nr:hypothetical protein BGY98DRAFT_1177312 [Russula aff. rugulosa BPL654]